MAFRRAIRYAGRRRRAGSLSRRTKGNQRAARQGRDSTQVTLSGSVQIPIPISVKKTDNTTGEIVSSNVRGLSIWQLLMGTSFFDNYRGMYDEIRLDGFRGKIIGNSAGSVTLASGLSSVGVALAIDRNGITGRVSDKTNEKIAKQTYKWTPFTHLYVPFTTADGEASSSARIDQLLSYGSVRTKNWSPGNAFVTYASCYPRSLQEKTQYIQTDKLRPSLIGNSTDKEISVDISTTNPNWRARHGFPSGLSRIPQNSNWGAEMDSDATTEKMTNGDELYDTIGRYDTQVAFDPVLLIGVYNVPSAADATQTFIFTMEYKCTVTLRGIRNGNGNPTSLGKLTGSINSLTDVSATASDVRRIVSGTDPDFISTDKALPPGAKKEPEVEVIKMNGVLGDEEEASDSLVEGDDGLWHEKDWVGGVTDTITENGEYIAYAPDYTAWSSVRVNVNVPTTDSGVSLEAAGKGDMEKMSETQPEQVQQKLITLAKRLSGKTRTEALVQRDFADAADAWDDEDDINWESDSEYEEGTVDTITENGIYKAFAPVGTAWTSFMVNVEVPQNSVTPDEEPEVVTTTPTLQYINVNGVGDCSPSQFIKATADTTYTLHSGYWSGIIILRPFTVGDEPDFENYPSYVIYESVTRQTDEGSYSTGACSGKIYKNDLVLPFAYRYDDAFDMTLYGTNDKPILGIREMNPDYVDAENALGIDPNWGIGTAIYPTTLQIDPTYTYDNASIPDFTWDGSTPIDDLLYAQLHEEVSTETLRYAFTWLTSSYKEQKEMNEEDEMPEEFVNGVETYLDNGEPTRAGLLWGIRWLVANMDDPPKVLPEAGEKLKP